jgi:hypothetical protein
LSSKLLPPPWAVVAFAAAAAGACYDFTAGYNQYCAQFGCGPDGSTPGQDGGSDGGSGACKLWGSNCAGPNECCNTLDFPQDAGQQLGCSAFGFCEFRPQGCLPEGYYCERDTDCCGIAHCDAGHCFSCGSAIGSRACAKANDCCIWNLAECSDAGACTEINLNGNIGAHCLGDDFCSSRYCQIDDAGDDGQCLPAPGGCGTPGTIVGPPGFSQAPCCPALDRQCGTTCQGPGYDYQCCSGRCGDAGIGDGGFFCDSTGPGDAGTCCLPLVSLCTQSSSCCSGLCFLGLCLPADGGITQQPVGKGCLLQTDCVSGSICDPVTQSCQSLFCYPDQTSGATAACGSLQLNSTAVFLTDGGRCLEGGESCSPNPNNCCSGVCLTIPIFMGTIDICAPITFFY